MAISTQVTPFQAYARHYFYTIRKRMQTREFSRIFPSPLPRWTRQPTAEKENTVMMGNFELLYAVINVKSVTNL